MVLSRQIEKYMVSRPCKGCKGFRLRPEALAVTVDGLNIIQITDKSIAESMDWIRRIRDGSFSKNGSSNKNALTKREQTIADQILKEIESRLNFLLNVGLDYLTLSRTASTLSGGEAQRIRLATQIGSGLMGVLYVCDEPSIGLHPADDYRLIETLQGLRDVGNTVLIVEHDEAIMRASDHIIDMGPGAGEHGGHVVAEGKIDEIIQVEDSLTGQYLGRKRRIPYPEKRRSLSNTSISIHGAKENNLKDIDVNIPLGVMVCITGVSGSGKSTLINEILYKALAQHFYKAKDRPGEFDAIQNLEAIDKVVNIDQSPIGRTPRSNPATYTGAFTPIRELFTTEPESRMRGYKAGRFSFNVNIPKIKNKLQTMSDVGLGYIKLGQPATQLSGGEAQRVKLSSELSKRSQGHTLYILDEPTTGLSFEDCAHLLNVLHRLVDAGNTVVLIEHHLDLIKNSDWIIDLGPGAGDKGGQVIAEGTPESLAKLRDSSTGYYLKHQMEMDSQSVIVN